MKTQAANRREAARSATSVTTASMPPARKPEAAAGAALPARLSFREKQELDALPARIEQLESQIAAVQAQLADPEFYARDAEAAKTAQRELRALEFDAAGAYARWEALEAKR